MSSYIHRVKAKAIVQCLDSFEETFEFRSGLSPEEFDAEMIPLLMEEFRGFQSNGHLDTDLNTAWMAFQADYRKEPRSALDSVRRLRTLLIDKYATNQRIKFYKDSNTVVVDKHAFHGLEPEQFQILEYLWTRALNEWTRVRDMIRDIDILDGVSDRTVRRFINDRDLHPEIRNLIEERPGKGYRFVLPPHPLMIAAE